MNRILVVNDEIKKLDVNENISVELINKNDFFAVNTIKIIVKENTDIQIDYNSLEASKLDINITILENSKCNIYEIRSGIKSKVQYKYLLQKNSHLTVNKFYHGEKIREVDLIYLDGEQSQIDYNFKTVSSKHQKYDMIIYHNYKNTISNINNKGLNVKDGELTFNVTSVVDKGKTSCILNQQNRIINMNDRKCQVNPNLLIDENDVEANHSALIGKFSDEELFYLQSRGINKINAMNLLIKGFLLNGFEGDYKDKVEKLIKKYGR